MSSNYLGERLSILPWNNTRLALEQLKDLLKCNGCQQLPTSPQYMGRCDHFFCQFCIKEMTDSFCPKCKIPSAPCDRKPDIVVGGLVSSVNEMFTLINGGEVKSAKGHEAPESSVNFKNTFSNTAATNSTSSKSGVLRSSASLGNLPTSKLSMPPTSTNVPKAKARVSRLPKKLMPQETNLVKSKSAILARECKNDEQNSSDFLSAESGSKSSVLRTPTPDKHSKLLKHLTIAITPITPAVNKRNMKGETTLHIACIKKDIETIKKLLEEGANPNTKDNAGWTPLHEACSNGFEEVASLLLQHGAIVDVPGNNNLTPLHDAVLTESIPVISLLRRWGASDLSRDIWGRTPRSIANITKSRVLIEAALDIPKDCLLSPQSNFGPLQVRLVILDSGLLIDQKKKLDSVVKLLKGKLAKDFSNEVTHIVVNCEGRNVCQRTIKYMMGVVSGKWILSHKWLDACLSIGGPANPSEFEVDGPRNNPYCLAPSKGRWNASKLLPGLFSGCHIYFHGSFGCQLPSKKELEGLVKAGDCVPLYREPNPESISEIEQTVPFHALPDGPLAKCSHYCIYAEGSNEPQLKYDMAHIKSLPLSWLYQCIDEWRLSSLHY